MTSSEELSNPSLPEFHVMDHVEGGSATGWQDARDVLALWRIMYSLVAGGNRP